MPWHWTGNISALLFLILLCTPNARGNASTEESNGSKEKVSEKASKTDKDENNRCLEKILSSYVNATCGLKENKLACKAWCENIGTRQCKGNKGEIRKLNCKRPSGKSGPQTCCCSVICESDEENYKRLDKEFNKTRSDICVKGPKSDIKQLLSEACRKEDKVHVAKKYCLEEKKGTYYCLTEGKCLGNKCKGCVEHECEIDGKSQTMTPPNDYMQLHLNKLDFDRAERIDIDDTAASEWCQIITDSYGCHRKCEDFGEKWCGGKPLDVGTNEKDCHREDDEACSCCCQPSCDPNRKQLACLNSKEGSNESRMGKEEKTNILREPNHENNADGSKDVKENEEDETEEDSADNQVKMKDNRRSDQRSGNADTEEERVSQDESDEKESKETAEKKKRKVKET